jgi:hypothetical protein
MSATDSYTAWCRDHECQHGHCPLGCEHPQPFATDGRLVCGRCAIVDGVFTDMIPCTPEVCGEQERTQ